jgi:hypothetical protein
VQTRERNEGPSVNSANLDSEADDLTSPGGAAPMTRGFSARLKGAGLWDLVQMECLARAHRIVQVVGEGGVGYLYFDRGHIIHASTAKWIGEAAAIEILGWTNGSFQSCERPWPEQRTILTSHEGLILQAAQLRDEGASSNLVAFPARGAAGAGAAVVPAPGAQAHTDEAFEELELHEIEEEGDSTMRASDVDEAVPVAKNGAQSGRTEVGVGGEFAAVMRLGPNGAVLSNRGGSEDLAETVSYVQRLLQLTGELLGLGEFSAAECGFVEGRCIIFADNGGETVALRPRTDASVNLPALRERLGL